MKTNSQWCGDIPPNASMPLRPIDDIQPDEWARYAKGQRTTDTRGIARIAEAKARIETDYRDGLKHADAKREGETWVLKHFPGLLENLIYYTHTERFCFGWRTPLSDGVLSELLDKISEFPCDYDIKCADGRKLST